MAPPAEKGDGVVTARATTSSAQTITGSMDLRAVFATRKIDERFDPDWIMVITGHKTDRVFKRYTLKAVVLEIQEMSTRFGRRLLSRFSKPLSDCSHTYMTSLLTRERY